MAHNFAQRLIGAGVLELRVQYGIDGVMTKPRAEAVLPPEARKNRTLAGRGLAVEIELRGPPGHHSIFKFHVRADEGITALRIAHDVVGFQFEVSRLLQ